MVDWVRERVLSMKRTRACRSVKSFLGNFGYTISGMPCPHEGDLYAIVCWYPKQADGIIIMEIMTHSGERQAAASTITDGTPVMEVMTSPRRAASSHIPNYWTASQVACLQFSGVLHSPCFLLFCISKYLTLTLTYHLMTIFPHKILHRIDIG